MSDKPGKHTDAWLEDEASVSRAYRELNQLQPPKHLDDAILAEARRAATGPDDNVIRVQRWRKWTMPAALAATVVFAVPLVVRVFNTAPSGFELNRSAKTTMTEKKTVERDLASVELSEQEAAAPGPQAMFDEQLSARKLASPAEATLERRMREEQASQSRSKSLASKEFEPTDNSATPPPAVAMTTEPDDTKRDSKQDAGLSQAADGAGFADAPQLASDDTTNSGLRPSRVAAINPSDDWRQDRRRMTSLSGSAADDAADQAGASIAAANVERKQDISELQEVIVTSNRYEDPWLEPTQWLDDIARIHDRGQPDEARRELGTFFSVYPDYILPTGFPLRAKDALVDQPTAIDNEIVPEATTWLRGIGLMAYRGDIDQARTQLARFVRIYPDHPLPADFPLSRDDARPIEQ